MRYGAKRICKDDLRLMLDNVHYNENNETIIRVVFDAIILCLTNKVENIILDCPHLNVTHVDRVINLLKERDDVSIRFKVINTPCLERNSLRDKSAKTEDIINLYNHLQSILVELNSRMENLSNSYW